MRGLQHHKRDICFLSNSTKTTNLRDLFIEAFFASMLLPIDAGFLWSSDPIEPELGPPDSTKTPQNNELQNRNELQWEAGLNFIYEKTGYELRARQKEALETLYNSLGCNDGLRKDINLSGFPVTIKS